MIPRRRGEVVQDATPPKANKVENAIRVWMVNPAILAQNEDWVTGGLVLPNGTLWGDAEDPTVVPGAPGTRRRKTAGNVDGLMKRTKRRALDRSEVDKTVSELDGILNGRDVAELINELSGR